MRSFAQATAVGGLLLTMAPAFAQAPVIECEQYEQVVEAAPTGFLAYRKFTIRDGVHRAYVPPWGDCTIVENVDLQMVCAGLPLNEEAANGMMISKVEDLQRCLPGWSVAPPVAVDGPGTILQGKRFIRYQRGGSVTVGVLVTELPEKSDLRFRLVFGVVFKPEMNASVG